MSASPQTPLSLAVGFQLEEIPRAVAWAKAHAPAWVDVPMFDLGLTEAITNALVHGALGLSSKGREDNIGAYLNEVRRRSLNPPSGVQQGLTVVLTEGDTEFEVQLSWRGTPCPADARTPKKPEALACSGLGQGIIDAVFSEVVWAEDGLSQRLILTRG